MKSSEGARVLIDTSSKRCLRLLIYHRVFFLKLAMGGSVELVKIGEKLLHQKVNKDDVCYCPTMDLVALGTIEHQVLIYRLNGQRVYNAIQKPGTPELAQLAWKPNGV